MKPVRIWSRIGRRPILAGGNSNGDIPMLRFAGGKGRPALRLLVLHDDAEREFDYTAGAEQALDAGRAQGWTVVSVKDDWASVDGCTKVRGGCSRRGGVLWIAKRKGFDERTQRQRISPGRGGCGLALVLAAVAAAGRLSGEHVT